MTTIVIPQPNDRLKSVIQAVPTTRLMLFQYKQQKGMTEDWKTWAWEMLDKGFYSDALTQLAGEDLNLNPFEFSSLVDSILKDLELDLTDDNVYYQYVLYIAHQVLKEDPQISSVTNIINKKLIITCCIITILYVGCSLIPHHTEFDDKTVLEDAMEMSLPNYKITKF